MHTLILPEINANGSFELQIPKTAQAKITHCKTIDFQPLNRVSTAITTDYADSVQWNNDKIARDLLQNFFDGHGQTLDGVRIKFTPTNNGKYKVRIDGDSTYTPDKAIYIGESTKRNDPHAAGNYGEGLKMTTLKLLKDKGAQNVKIGSDNWTVNYVLEPGSITDKKLLTYNLNKNEQHIEGNFFEFETDDISLLNTIRNSINRFYHSGNTHFKAPELENDLFSIKRLPPKEKGGIYIAGQRFEYNGEFDSIEGAAICLKEKPPTDVLDPSRDRLSLNKNDLQKIATWLAQKTSTETRLKVIKTLEPFIEIDPRSHKEVPTMQTFLDTFVYESTYKPSSDNNYGLYFNKIKFPDKYVSVADNELSRNIDIVRDFINQGYKICSVVFAGIGMKRLRDYLNAARAHKPIAPNEIEIEKIKILRTALQKLSPALKEKHFTNEELNTKIYLFNNSAADENNVLEYKDTLAEAIVEHGESKGFWINRRHLNINSFAEILETALHELCHKAGGDGSADFSYKLTDVNRDTLAQLIEKPEIAEDFKILSNMWRSLTQ